MRYLTLLLILNTFLWSTNLTKYKIYESEDRVDIMLYFDTPYDKQIIKKQDSDSTILIILPQMKSKYKIANHINSPIIQSFKAISYKNQTMIELQGVDKFSVKGVNTIDNYGLRLRIKPLLATNPKQYPNENKIENSKMKFKTKDESDMTSASIKVLLALFWIFAALFLLKTWILKKDGEPISMPSWLTKQPKSKKETKPKPDPQKEIIIEIAKKEEKKSKEIIVELKKEEPKETQKKEEKKSEPDPFQVIFQKHIDKENTVSLLEYNGNNYLILTGSTNMLLEMNVKAQTAIPTNNQEIQNILEQQSEFIQLQNSKFNEYKKKASKDAPIVLGASL